MFIQIIINKGDGQLKNTKLFILCFKKSAIECAKNYASTFTLKSV